MNKQCSVIADLKSCAINFLLIVRMETKSFISYPKCNVEDEIEV